MRRKSIISIVFTLFLICFIVYGLFLNTVYRKDKMRREPKDECIHSIQKHFYENVTDALLGKISADCLNGEAGVDSTLFDFNLLRNDLPNFTCTTAMLLNEPRPLVALASYPGSGNTWTRELIEALTGILTGSIYLDWNFKGSETCPSDGKIFIVKTHIPSNASTWHGACHRKNVTQLNYSKAILILRNPYSALVAEFNRQQTLKMKGNPGVNLAPKEAFGTNKWEKFVEKESETWRNMAIYWLKTFRKPVYALIYENVRKSTEVEMYKLSKFLGISIQLKSLYCLLGDKVGNFKRQKPAWMTPETLYDFHLRTIVNQNILSVTRATGLLQVNSYILPES